MHSTWRSPPKQASAFPADEMLYVLDQGKPQELQRGPTVWSRHRNPDSPAGIYLVEARVSAQGRNMWGDVASLFCLHALKELPVKVSGKVPALVFTAEVKLWLLLSCWHWLAPWLFARPEVWLPFPTLGRLTRIAEARNVVEAQQQILACKESCFLVSWLSCAIPPVGKDSKIATLAWKERQRNWHGDGWK